MKSNKIIIKNNKINWQFKILNLVKKNPLELISININDKKA